MKPIFLELQAFGPFVEKQSVDFEKLSEGGMFLIKGDTGSGKTTIFDAMTFALYGGSSGSEEKSKGRNNLKEWRCCQAPEDLETIVALTFSSKGKKYFFKRTLKKDRKNFNEKDVAQEILEDGTQRPLCENLTSTALNKIAEELVGLTREQFRQVVLLPQGQFERFLLAGSEDKEKILTKIFGTERWGGYADCFYEAANKRATDLGRLKERIDTALQDYKVQDLDELSARIEGFKTEQSEIDKNHTAFNAEKKQKQLNEDIALAEQYKPLHNLEHVKAGLEGKSEEIKRKRLEYDEAVRAEDLRQIIKEFEDAAREYDNRKRLLTNAQNEVPAKTDLAQKAQTALNDYERTSPTEQNSQKIGELEGKREVYTGYSDLVAKERSASLAKERAKAKSDNTKSSYESAVNNAKIAKEAFDSAEKTEIDYRNRYYAGIYGVIASDLKEGEKCPVCGSIDHPSPAQKTPDSVEKTDLEAKESATKAARQTWDKAEKVRSGKEKEKNEADDELKEAEGALSTAKANRASAESMLIPGITDLAGLEAAIKALIQENKKYETKRKELSDNLTEAQQNLTAAKQNALAAAEENTNAEAKYKEASQKLQEKLAEKGFSDIRSVKDLLRPSTVINALHKEIVEYDNSVATTNDNLSKTRKELDGTTEPDRSKFENRQQEITKESEEYTANKTRLEKDIREYTEKHKILSEEKKHYDDNIIQASDDLKFAKTLRGDTGTGISRYVLAVMFGQVLAEANRMLEKVHGGRYRLARTSESGTGRKRGLDLIVHDNRSPEKEGRGVSMLSGGEKFLVSLALSIGMSTIAQSTGVRIEALFIDEGFGTLDNNSIGDAMEVLDCVRKSSGTIGIISHVSVLEENIATQLEVIKRKEGSYIKLL